MSTQSTPKTGQNPSEPVLSIKGVKAFNQDLTCRNFQFKEGEICHHNEKVEACESGFHFCENPLDTFSYYEPSKSVFHEVEGGGDIDRHGSDSKVACSDIKIGAKISLHNLIGASIEFMFARKYKHKNKANKDGSANSSTGYGSANSSTGDSSANSSTGYRSANSSTGYSSANSSTGDSSANSSTGDSSANSSTGYSSAAIATGLNSKCMAGRYGCIALQWWNDDEKRCEMKCAETGCGDGSDGKLKAGVWYKLNDAGEFVEVEDE